MRSVPTLDLRDYPSDKTAFSFAVRKAYEEFGFCCFKGHNLSPETVARAYRSIHAFFALPEHVKEKYFTSELSGKRGYVPFKTETAKGHGYPDLKEFWHTGRENVPEKYTSFMAPNIWPAEVPDFKEAVLALYKELDDLGQDILKPMSLAVGQSEDYLGSITQNGNSILRALHYPPLFSKGEELPPENEPCIRAQAHEDAGLITILISARGAGLQLLNRQNEWLPVSCEEGAVIVNVGDMMERLTNHVFQSTTHRVVNPEGELAYQSRYSIPFFMDPQPDFLIKTLDTCITESNPNPYPEPILENDFLMRRLREIKISK